MVASALQVFIVLFAALPFVEAFGADGMTIDPWRAAIAAAKHGPREALAIGALCLIEMVVRIGAHVAQTPLRSDAIWSFAVLHLFVATGVVICFGIDLVLCVSLSELRQTLSAMRFELAAAALMIFCAVREIFHRPSVAEESPLKKLKKREHFVRSPKRGDSSRSIPLRRSHSD